jgi:hypothetical protein
MNICSTNRSLCAYPEAEPLRNSKFTHSFYKLDHFSAPSKQCTVKWSSLHKIMFKFTPNKVLQDKLQEWPIFQIIKVVKTADNSTSCIHKDELAQK